MPALLRRAPVDLPRPPAAMQRRWRRLSLGEVDLGFAGRRAPDSVVHRAIAALDSGVPLRLRHHGQRWELVDGQGVVVGRLSRAFCLPPGMACVDASVLAIVVRRREDAEAPYRERLRCERWEVVVPELVLEPCAGG